ncbi:hypothetical protein RHSIM_Rhsim09G0208300 [Rhododendron simsii]|uniref:Senescence regulator n=1 Tax=Rhododendron simsii TaxID=118357 RepID=A0A834GE67_RHOSS|nr:hypothetical protein RHSIM_Rhsim09G0208300 [Rhododendron simsii]
MSRLLTPIFSSHQSILPSTEAGSIDHSLLGWLRPFSRQENQPEIKMKHKTSTNHHHTITGFTLTQGGGGVADTPQSTMAVRFLGPLKPPDPNPTPFELDESDVVWSSSTDLSDSTDLVSPSPPTASSSPTTPRLHNHQFHPLKSGLSAALSNDLLPLVRRKPALNPSLSAASAARTIPPVPAATSPAASKFPQSAPVNVPIWPKKVGVTNLGRFDEVVDEEELEEEMVPPHEIVARSHMMTFSVFEGVGRTLKGRDLRRVRNAVFQKTGTSIGFCDGYV